jgi:hypothetical protein
MVRLSLLLLALSAACSSESTFVASDADFAEFRSWDHASEAPQSFGAGHPTGPSTTYLSRHTHGHSYPAGTMLVKAFNSDPDPALWDVFAMAKRGGDFNPSGAVGWEFFRIHILSNDMPTIVSRGIFALDIGPDAGDAYQVLGSAVDGLCNNCHGTTLSDATDHVLTPDFYPGK